MNPIPSGEPETTNTERALWGMASLTGLVEATGDSRNITLTPGADRNGPAQVLTDVLVNLRHYADAAGIEFDAVDDAADEFYRTEIGASQTEPGPQILAYRRYTAQFGHDTTQALLHLARTAAIAVAWMDRQYIETKHGGPLTDVQWARVAPHLDSYHEHVSWSESNGLYLDQIFAKAAIPDVDGKDSEPQCR